MKTHSSKQEDETFKIIKNEDYSKSTSKSKVNKADSNSEEIENNDIEIIENYFLNTTLTKSKMNNQLECIVNSVKLEHLFLNPNILPLHDRTKIDIMCDELLLSFKKADLNNNVFPCLLNFFKETFIKAKQQLSSSTNPNSKESKELNPKQLYYVLRIVESSATLENKIHDLYSKLIKRNGFGISSSLKSSLTSEIKYSTEYNDFVNRLANWYSITEISILNFFLISLFFGVSFAFDAKTYSVENNLDFSVNMFAKKNFYRLTSLVLKNAELGVKLFGSVSYSSLAFILMSGFYSGASIPSIFFSTKFCHYALVGTYVFNWIVGSLTGYLDHFTATCEYYRISEILLSLNTKLENVLISGSELIKLLTLYHLDKQFDLGEMSMENIQKESKEFTNVNGIEEDIKKGIYQEKSKNKVYSQKYLEYKIEELSLLVTRYLGKTDDISEEEMKEIDIQATKWVEELVKYDELEVSRIVESSIKNSDDADKSDNNGITEKLELNEKDISETLNGSFYEVDKEKIQKIYRDNQMIAKDYKDERDWVLINIIKSKVGKSAFKFK